jgi:hypothetical protein
MTDDMRMPEAIAMDSGDPEADDEQIAATIADFWLAMYSWRWYCLSTDEYYSPCSTPHDWRRKTAVGINTRDRDRARRWAIDALLDGGRVRRTIGPETWSHWEPDFLLYREGPSQPPSRAGSPPLGGPSGSKIEAVIQRQVRIVMRHVVECAR